MTMTIKQPEEFSRRVLLAVTGLSPQVVTETLYGLCIAQSRPFVPTEVHLLTTQEGYEHALLSLLHPEQGHFHAFCQDYALTGRIQFNSDSIHVLRTPSGVPLPDIRSPEENGFAADTITSLVRNLTGDDNAALHVSIAGGRKTMGFYLGYALSLFARPQDRLSHVLVPPPFESHLDFYYPPRKPRVLYTRDSKPVDTSDATVTLADIPFVRLRTGLPESLRSGSASFSETVAQLQSALTAVPKLVIDFTKQTIRCGGHAIKLKPVEFAWYGWLASLKQTNHILSGYVRYTEVDCKGFLDFYRAIVTEDASRYDDLVYLLKNGMPDEYFQERNTRVNNALKKQLGVAATPYLIHKHGKRPLTRSGLALASETIEII